MAAQAVRSRVVSSGLNLNASQETAKAIFLGRDVVPLLDARKGVSSRTTAIHDVAGNASGIGRSIASLIDTAAHTNKLVGPVVNLAALTSPLNIVTAVTGLQSATHDIRHGVSRRTRLIGLFSFVLKFAQGASALESLPSKICALATGLLAVSGKTVAGLSISARVFSLLATALGITVFACNAIKSTISIYETLKFRLKLRRSTDPVNYLLHRTLVNPITLLGELKARDSDKWITRLKEKGEKEFVKRLKKAFPNEKRTETEWKNWAEEWANQIPEGVWKDELKKLVGGQNTQEFATDPFQALGWKLEFENAQARKDQVMKRLLGVELFSKVKEELYKLQAGTPLQDYQAIKDNITTTLLPKITKHQWKESIIHVIKVATLLLGITGMIMLCISPGGVVGILASCYVLTTSLFLAGVDLRDLVNALKSGEVGRHDTKLIAASLIFCCVIAIASIALTFSFGLALAPLGLTLGICAIWALSSIIMLILIARRKIDPSKVSSISQYLEYVRKEKDPTKREAVWNRLRDEAKTKDPQTYILLRKCELYSDSLFSQDAKEIEKSLAFYLSGSKKRPG